MAFTLRTKSLFVLVAVGVLSACTQPIRNVSDAPVPTKGLTEEQMIGAIKRAGSGLGWAMVEAGPGQMEGTLRLRSHVAVVQVQYNPDTYSITYKDSTNLSHTPKANTIHKNYNGWIQNLDNAIRVQLTNI
jgi:hypothetical protein